MRKMFWKLATLALRALQAVLRPVTRTVVRLAGRLQLWRDQAEINYLLEAAQAKLGHEWRRDGSRPLAVSVHREWEKRR